MRFWRIRLVEWAEGFVAGRERAKAAALEGEAFREWDRCRARELQEWRRDLHLSGWAYRLLRLPGAEFEYLVALNRIGDDTIVAGFLGSDDEEALDAARAWVRFQTHGPKSLRNFQPDG